MEVHSGDIYRLKDGSVWIILHEQAQDEWAGFNLKAGSDSSKYFVGGNLAKIKRDLTSLDATLLTGGGTLVLKLVADKLLEREND